jgi:hypothetical protein
MAQLKQTWLLEAQRPYLQGLQRVPSTEPQSDVLATVSPNEARDWPSLRAQRLSHLVVVCRDTGAANLRSFLATWKLFFANMELNSCWGNCAFSDPLRQRIACVLAKALHMSDDNFGSDRNDDIEDTIQTLGS